MSVKLVARFQSVPAIRVVSLPEIALPLLVGFAAFLWGISILSAQFHGEDEALVMKEIVQMLDALRDRGPNGLADEFMIVEHPPARYLAAMPFVATFGDREWALRLPNLVLWAGACALATRLAMELAGHGAGLGAGLFLALSGLFSLEGMGHGHAGPVFWIMMLLLHMKRDAGWGLESKNDLHRYCLGGIYCMGAFLWFTALLPICGMYHLIHCLQARRRLSAWFAQSIPFGVFYALYYGTFLGIPAMQISEGVAPFGQLNQNLARGAHARLNVQSLLENLQALNWHVLPYVSWIVLPMGLVWQARNAPRLLWLLLPYGLIFCFYIVGNTPQHFFVYYCLLVPFACAGYAALGWINPTLKRGIAAALIVSLAIFSHVFHARNYTEIEYPTNWVNRVWGRVLWPNNLVRPMEPLARDLARMLRPEDGFIVLIDGALPLYYFRDARYRNSAELGARLAREPQALISRDDLPSPDVRLVVAFEDQRLNAALVEKTIRYQGSRICLHVLRPE